jgi:lipopolysaccharide transport system ATP-binding protein
MAAVTNLCRTGLLLERGRMKAWGPLNQVIDEYLVSIEILHEGDVGERTDREGNGRLRFKSVSFNGVRTKVLRSGEATAIALSYEGNSTLKSVEVSLAFYSALGQPVLYLSSDLSGDSFSDIPPSGNLVGTFDRLPLMPGSYSLNISCTVNGVLADWVKDAARIQVAEGDYFGTGKLPSPEYGSVLVPYRWKIE